MDLLDNAVVPEHARDVKHRARTFAAEHVEPVAATYHESGAYPWDVLEAGMDAGLVAGNIGEQWGGEGFDLAERLAIAEELYRADAGIALTLQLAAFGCDLVEEYGTAYQGETFLEPVAAHDQLSGLAVSEPETGSDMAGMTTSAEKTDEGWVLNGEKYWVGNAVEADWLTVYAKTESREKPHRNYSVFIVDTETEGYHAEHIPEKIGMRASKQGHIVFDDCVVPDENLVGERGQGFPMVADFFNKGRVIVGGHGLGLAAAAIEEAWSFVHEREAFDQRVSEFQSVQHTLAEMRTEFEAARALNWRAAEAVADGDQPGLWAAMTKLKSTEVAMHCAERGMQLHGGRSILAENRISRVYRDVRIPVIYEGANEIQRDLIYRQSQ